MGKGHIFQDFLILCYQEIPLYVQSPAKILCLLPNAYLIVSSSSQPNNEDSHFPTFHVSSPVFSWKPVANFQAVLQISLNNLSSLVCEIQVYATFFNHFFSQSTCT